MEEKLLKIINHYGVNNQQRKLEEEVFELQEAIINAQHNILFGVCRRPSDRVIQNIAEEIADVFVMVCQFKEYYDIDGKDILKIVNEKIDRQLGRMEDENRSRNVCKN